MQQCFYKFDTLHKTFFCKLNNRIKRGRKKNIDFDSEELQDLFILDKVDFKGFNAHPSMPACTQRSSIYSLTHKKTNK